MTLKNMASCSFGVEPRAQREPDCERISYSLQTHKRLARQNENVAQKTKTTRSSIHGDASRLNRERFRCPLIACSIAVKLAVAATRVQNFEHQFIKNEDLLFPGKTS